MPYKLFILPLFFLFSGCLTTHTPEPTTKTTPWFNGFADHLFVTSFKPVSEQTIFALAPEQRAHFMDYFHRQDVQTTRADVRLYNFLEQHLVNFNYRGDTLKAADAMQTNSGNCMSLAILTKALAQLANLEIRFRVVNSAPVYRLEKNLLLVSRHVRSKIMAPDINGEINFGSGITIDYLPTRGNRVGEHISKQTFVAMYYQNIASDYLLAQNYSAAYWTIRQALEKDPNNINSLTQLAVIYRQTGHIELASSVYQFALEHLSPSVDMLDNYVYLLEQQHQYDKAREIESRIVRVEDINPYTWMLLGNRAYRQQSWDEAVKYYRKAMALAPYMEKPYVGLAKSYYQLNQTERAAKAFENAIKNSYLPENKRLYQAKLRMIDSENL